MCVFFSAFDLELHWMNSNEVSQLSFLLNLLLLLLLLFYFYYYYYYYYYYFQPYFARTNSKN